MAKTMYDSEAIQLQDGTDLVLIPLAIGRLKRFMKAWGEFANLEDEQQAFDIYVTCCGISLERLLAERFPEPFEDEEGLVISKDYKNYLEDVLDMQTIYKILDVCGGLKLNDPKLLAEAERLAAEQVGKN